MSTTRLRNNPVRRIAFLALLSAGALVLGFVESLFPLPVPIPGVKLGLSNVFVLLGLYLFGWREAGLVMLAKVTLSSLLFAGMGALPYSLAGGLLSLGLMALVRPMKSVSIIGCSCLGAAAHGLGQVLVGTWLTQTPQLLLYATPLMLTGLVSGGLLGYGAGLVQGRLQKLVHQNEKPSP